MLNQGRYTMESYAYLLNTDRSILKLNQIIEKFGYRFICVTASELECDFSEIFNVPKGNDRPLTIIIGRKQHGISHELHHSIVHTAALGPMFMHMEFPEIILLQKIDTFELPGDETDFIIERSAFNSFHPFVSDLILQLRLYKAGEIRCYQYFQMTSETRQISFRKTEISIGSSGGYYIDDEEAKELSTILKAKYTTNELTELAVKNFNIAYDIPDGRIRYITVMTCLESLFNLGKDQIAHTIARHLSLIISKSKEEFLENYKRIKKLYNHRNAIVHGGEYKGELVKDYLDLADKVRHAISYCNVPELTKEVLFENLNSKGF